MYPSSRCKSSQCCIIAVFILLSSSAVTLARGLDTADEYSNIQEEDFEGTRQGCGACHILECPLIGPEACPSGSVVKDECDCCPICDTPPISDSASYVYNEESGDVAAAEEDSTSLLEEADDDGEDEDMPEIETIFPLSALVEGSNCSNVQCPRQQICMLNMQGLPICRCPSVYVCRSKKNSGKVCGRDGVTYKTRCHLQIAECTHTKKIRVAHRGMCKSGSAPAKDFDSIFHGDPSAPDGYPLSKTPATKRKQNQEASDFVPYKRKNARVTNHRTQTRVQQPTATLR